MPREIVLAIGLSIASGCAAPSALTAPPPELRTEAKHARDGSFELDLVDLSDERVCARHPKFNDFCVTELRRAIEAGVRGVLGQFIHTGKPGDRYVASFRLLEFSQTPVYFGDGDFEQQKITVRWRFDLRNEAGDRLLGLTESTNRTLRDLRKTRDTLKALLEDVMERIGEALNEAEWTRSGPAHPTNRE
jgi:hypothetical protein